MRVPRIRLRWRDLKAPAITLALAGALTMGLAATAPAPAQADDSTPQITDMSEQDYNDLGLTVNEEIPKDTEGPYSQDKKTTVVTRNEVYMAANGANGNRYTLRDKLENVERTDLNGNSKLKDGYGNIWGAAKFWQDINDIDHGSDLYKHSDYGGGDWSNLSYNKDETVLANQNSDFSGIHATSTELCLDASTGKDAYVAELRAYGDDATTTIDGKPIKGKIAIKLFKFDGNDSSRTRTEVAELTPSVNSNMVYGDSGEFKYLRAGYLQELDAVFNIAAGDVDGDGVDEIFVYTGCYVDDNDRRMAVVDMFDVKDTDASNVGHLVMKVDAGKVDDFKVTKKGNNDIRWTQLQSCPVVTLATGDLDRDFKDDLAITVSAPYGKQNIKDSTYCELFSWDESKQALTQVSGLGNNGKIALGTDAGTMLGASAAFGTFIAYDDEGNQTSNSVTGLIVAGYNWAGGSYSCDNNNIPCWAGYRFVYYDVNSGEFKLSDYQVLKAVYSSMGINYIPKMTYKDVGQDKRYPCTMAPIALCTANLEGLTAEKINDSILIGGDVYSGFACTTGAGANGLGRFAKTISMSGQHYNASNKYDHKGIDHVWISDVKSGCVLGDNTYRESFIAVVGSHRDEDLTKPDDYYWMTASHATMLSNGSINTGEEEVITESNRRNTRYGTFISLALPDVDKDSVQISFDSAYKVYTNPRVLAVLQDAPFYQDLEDSFGYLVLGGTGYGESKGSTNTNGLALSGELGMAVEVETGAPVVTGRVSVDGAVEASYDYQQEKSVNMGVTYESHAGEGDKVVIYSLPMVYYLYTAVNEETNDVNGIAAPVALDAETSVISVETYDRIAKAHNMTSLSTFLRNRSGDPSSYTADFDVNTMTGSDSFGLGTAGVKRAYTGKGYSGVNGSEGGSVTQSIDTETGDSHGMEVGLTVNGDVVGGAKLGKHEFMAGVCFGASAGYTHEWISSEGLSFEGTIDNLPKEAKGNYGFQWRLGVNMVDRDKFEAESDGVELGSKDTDKFWIVGYDVKDVQQPTVPAVTGFTATSVDSTSVTLSWDAVLPEDSSLSYGITMITSNMSDPNQGSSAHSDASTTSYTWDGLRPNSKYQFVIAVIDTNTDPLGIRSPVVTVSTMPLGMEFSVSGPQADVGEGDAASDASTLRYDASVTAAPGQRVTLKALGQVNDLGRQQEPQYRWYCKKRGSDKLELCSAPSPEPGEPSVLAIEIPTDKTEYEELQGAQYYCAAVHNDIEFDTGVTTLKINQSTLTTTNRTRPTLKRLAALFGADARSFLDHSKVNTAGPAIEEPTEPSTPSEPESPGASDSADKQAKATATVKKTTAGNLSNTGDRTIAIVAGVAVLGIIAIGAAVLLLRKNRR